MLISYLREKAHSILESIGNMNRNSEYAKLKLKLELYFGRYGPSQNSSQFK